jgi:spore germination protein PD
MIFTVINEEICVKKIKIASIVSSSNLFIGDVKSITISSWFDTPPEKVIVGATVGVTEQGQGEQGE